MNINLNLKRLMAAALLSSFTTLVVASTDEHAQAPEVSAADAKLSFWDMPYLEEAFIDTVPDKRKDGLSVGKLRLEGKDKSHLIKVANEIANNKEGKFDSMLISYKDNLIFESYYKRGRVDLPHFQASVTKAYVSIAIGRAIQLGYLTMADLNKPLVSFINNIALEKLADGAEKITLHQAMRMSSGVRVSDDKLKLIMDSSSKITGTNITQELLQHTKAISPTAQTFKYQDADPRMTMQVLNSVVPGSAKDFIKNEVLAKIGITHYDWKNDINGLPIPESTSNMTSRDMIKFGQLILNKGKWKGEQLISEAFITKATNGETKPTEEWIPDSFLYGYFWYQTEMKVDNKSYTARFAWGGGEQYILTVEQLDLVVVFTAHARENNTMQLMAENILPVFIK